MWPNTPPGGGLYRHSAYEWVLLLQVEKYWHCDYEWVYSRWRIIPAICLWMSLLQVENYWHCAYEWVYSRWRIIPAKCLWMSLFQVENYTGNAHMNDFIPGGKKLALCLWMILFQKEKYWHCAYEWITPGGVIPASGLRMSLTNVWSYLCVEVDASVWRCLPQVCGDASLRCLPQVEMPPAGGDAPISVLIIIDNWVYWIYEK